MRRKSFSREWRGTRGYISVQWSNQTRNLSTRVDTQGFQHSGAPGLPYTSNTSPEKSIHLLQTDRFNTAVNNPFGNRFKTNHMRARVQQVTDSLWVTRKILISLSCTSRSIAGTITFTIISSLPCILFVQARPLLLSWSA